MISCRGIGKDGRVSRGIIISIEIGIGLGRRVFRVKSIAMVGHQIIGMVLILPYMFGRLMLALGADDEFPFTTVVDILSQNPEFSTFLRLVQRTGHIPTLNEMDNYTLFAPVNSAFITGNFSDAVDSFALENYILADDVLDVQVMDPGTYILQTQAYPVVLHKGNDGNCALNDVIHVVDPNLKPNSQNATVHGIDSFMANPPTLSELVSRRTVPNKESMFFMKHLIEKTLENNTRFSHLLNGSTLLLPTDNALSQFFNEIELSYLFDLGSAEFDVDDRKEDVEVLLRKLTVNKMVGGVIHKGDSHIVFNNDGDAMDLHSINRGHDLVINGSAALVSNMVFDSGIVHYVYKLPLLDSGISFNVEKYMLGLNASSFVQDLYIRGFQDLVTDPSIEQTIFVTEDESFDNSGTSGFSKSQLLYHFIEKKIDLNEEFSSSTLSSRLYESMFCSSNKRLGGMCQRMKISNSNDNFYLNEKYSILNSHPINVDNTLIYIISDALLLPGDLVPSINPFFHCSTTLKFMQQLNLLDLKPNNEGYTLFLPCFDSWANIQLITDYLQTNVSALNILMKNYVINGLVYSDETNFTLDSTNLFGKKVNIKTRETEYQDEYLTVSLSTVDHDIALRRSYDMIFNQGVVHPLNEIYFPKALDINLRQLIETIGTHDFLIFLEKYPEFNSILSGSAPYSLLIPTPRSLLMEGIDLNYTKLEKFLKLHILPENQTRILLECEDNVDTIAGESLQCREASDNVLLLSVVDGVDKEVRILKKGCTTHNPESCIFMIDRPISVQWLNKERYHITLPALSFALGTVLGIMFLFSLLLCVIVTCTQRKPLKSYNSHPNLENEPDEQQSLVNSERSAGLNQSSSYHSTVNADRNQAHHGLHRFESSYSINAKTPPMKMGQNSTDNHSRTSRAS